MQLNYSLKDGAPLDYPKYEYLVLQSKILDRSLDSHFVAIPLLAHHSYVVSASYSVNHLEALHESHACHPQLCSWIKKFNTNHLDYVVGFPNPLPKNAVAPIHFSVESLCLPHVIFDELFRNFIFFQAFDKATLIIPKHAPTVARTLSKMIYDSMLQGVQDSTRRCVSRIHQGPRSICCFPYGPCFRNCHLFHS